MKMLKCILFVSISCWVLAGCASTSTQSESVNGTDQNRQLPRDAITDEMNFGMELSDYLRRVPGVLVRGSGSNISVTIRGTSSFYSSNEPLFVLDGQAVGRSYSDVSSLINARDIDYVRVLKDSEASGYGVRGANGVVMIYTKR